MHRSVRSRSLPCRTWLHGKDHERGGEHTEQAHEGLCPWSVVRILYPWEQLFGKAVPAEVSERCSFAQVIFTENGAAPADTGLFGIEVLARGGTG